MTQIRNKIKINFQIMILFYNHNKRLIPKIIIKFVNYKVKMTINNIKLNTYILIKNQ